MLLFIIAITLVVLVIAIGVGYLGEVLAIRKARKDTQKRNQAHKR